jgi:hypothetical protein
MVGSIADIGADVQHAGREALRAMLKVRTETRRGEKKLEEK